jgi:hypothetical protein
MTENAIKFIQNYNKNNSTYNNGYLVFNPGYFKNKAWFRFNASKNDWEWSNDLIYWNKQYDTNSKSSVWINQLLDSKNDINYIISYLRLSNVNKNILQMNDPIQRISTYIDQIYNFLLNFATNKISENDLQLNVINSALKNIKVELDRIINQDVFDYYTFKKCNENNQVLVNKDILTNLNNTIGNLNNQINHYKNDISELSNYLINIDNNQLEMNNSVLCDSFIIYQSGLLSELNVEPSFSISENTNLIYKNMNMLNKKLDELVNENNQLKEQLDEQILEKNLCEKRINGNRCIMKSLEISNKKLQQNIDLLKTEHRKQILEIEGYKNTIEGNTMKIFGITQELEKKDILIQSLLREKKEIAIQTMDISDDTQKHLTNKEDYEILSLDEFF